MRSRNSDLEGHGCPTHTWFIVSGNAISTDIVTDAMEIASNNCERMYVDDWCGKVKPGVKTDAG